ncbi:Clp protease N-terminal domain-containing protein [Conexibacter sp. DBS9H8]|uniref:Clp protease N-terminal domain-containing protein n=1 Tax=Conexibacter sp. DBS9H8 TaxID=2937801 RepID=UPI00200C9261|nr:Clp protease N-terminal domain-containing protein [Conexibacter sp. DBS9H8]
MNRRSRLAGLLHTILTGPKPTDRLRAIPALRRELDELETAAVADGLAAGMSWREIGEALGTSKQAAHHRHSRNVRELDRAASSEQGGRAVIISPEVRSAVRIARREAALLGAATVGSGHLLLGLLQCQEPLTAGVLTRLGVGLEATRDRLEATVEMPADVAAARAKAAAPEAAARVGLSELAAAVLNRALSERAGGGEPLAAIDLLRALLTNRHGGASQTLEALGIDGETALAEIARATGQRP